MDVQIFGTQKSQDTKKALRFFKERGVKPQFVDLGAGKTAPGELKRFVQQAGLDGLIDKGAKAYEASGLEYLRLTDDALLERLLDNPALLRLPPRRDSPFLGGGADVPRTAPPPPPDPSVPRQSAPAWSDLARPSSASAPQWSKRVW